MSESIESKVVFVGRIVGSNHSSGDPVSFDGYTASNDYVRFEPNKDMVGDMYKAMKHNNYSIITYRIDLEGDAKPEKVVLG